MGSVLHGAADREQINVPFVMLLAAVGALGGMMFGFDIAIITGAGPFLEHQFQLNSVELGFAYSSLLFGCMLGAAFAGAAADRFGRRRLMLVVSLGFAVTCVATGAAETFVGFNVARFLAGITVGAVSLVAPMYVAEVAPASLRGRMGALYQLAIVFGILGSFLINFLLRNEGDDAWRYMFWTGIVPAAIYFVLMLLAPETPRFLVQAGQTDRALALLTRIVGPTAGKLEFDGIVASISDKPRAVKDLLALDVRRPLITSLFLAILIHFSGINTVIDYAPVIFRSAGFTMDAALFATFVVGIANFTFTLVSLFTIDRVGRRPLYIIGSVGMGLALTALSLAVVTGHFSGLLVLILIVIYLIFFASCIGPVFWTLLPEIFPNHIRGRALMVPVLTQWAANAITVLFFPVVFSEVGQAATFILLTTMCFLQAAFAYKFVPETRNRTLEEIAQGYGEARNC